MGRQFPCRHLHQVRVRADAGRPVCRADRRHHALYEIAFNKKLDSTIPPLDEIRDQVTRDYKTMQATLLAQRAGTNFAAGVAAQLATGQNFASVCIAAGLQSRAAAAVFVKHAGIAGTRRSREPRASQRAAFGTASDTPAILRRPRTAASSCMSSPGCRWTDGHEKRSAAIHRRLRRQRESEAFDQWLQVEANSQLRTTPVNPQNAAGRNNRRERGSSNCPRPPPASSGKSPSCSRMNTCSRSTSPPACSSSPDRLDPERPSLMTLLHAGIAAGKPWARERNLTYLNNAHRPDFETSGVLLLAKNKPALVALANLFGSGKTGQKIHRARAGKSAGGEI